MPQRQSKQVKLIQRKTIPRKWIQRLNDTPLFIAPNGKTGWNGYEHFTDPTAMTFNKLTFPSTNCTIPSFDKIVPDKGKTLYGQIFTEDVGIIGNKERFKNAGGIEMEVRVFPSLNSSLKDVIQAGYYNNRFVLSTIVGTFQIGESISGQTSGASGNIVSITGTVITINNPMGNFTVGETILGQTSLATATTVKVPIIFFQQLTENTNPLPRGVHEYYFDSWFDTKLLNSIANSVPSKNLQRLIWVNGYRDTSSPVKGAVYSWTGGIAVITNFVVNTSITIDPLTTWRSLGFTEAANPAATSIIINGVSYLLTGPVVNGILTDLDTSTIQVTSTTGIAIGDTATSKIEVDVSPIPFDHCRQNKGYMYYGNWTSQQEYQSNGFNREFNYFVSDFQAIQNDLYVTPSLSSPYTGTTEEVFHIVIDSVNPDINIQQFVGTGLNDAQYDTSGYTGSAGIENIYKMVIVADFTLRSTPLSGSIVLGEVIKGNKSGALATVIGNYTLAGDDVMGLSIISGAFQAGEVITGQSGAGTATTNNADGLTISQNWVQFYKNGNVQTITVGVFTGTINPLGAPPFTTTPLLVNLPDSLTMTFSNNYGHTIGDYFQLDIKMGGVDTFSWQVNKGPITSNVPLSTSPVSLQDGVQVQWNKVNGHTVGDFWDVTATPAITRAWDNFYYNLPIRRPGEGYIYQLPSNFWTQDTQEDSLYINSSYGEWSVVQTILSADLQSETVVLTPLKQAGANKVLYPYLTGHNNDLLVYINTSYQLDTLGRLPLIEKPQTGYLSDPVKLDFLVSSFIGGRIKYMNKRLHITSPKEGVMHVYDDFKKYWQPLKSFPEMGILTVIGTELACHSNIRNQTFTLFTNASGDNGQEYSVTMRTPYHAPNGIWSSTYSNQSMTTGYITGAPPLIHTFIEGVNGCAGIFPHLIQPIVCKAPDRSPFGEGPFGSHPFGSDLDAGGSYFNEIYKAYAPVLQYYLCAIDISCTTTSHTYSILNMGMNGMLSGTGNNGLVNPSNLAVNNL